MEKNIGLFCTPWMQELLPAVPKTVLMINIFLLFLFQKTMLYCPLCRQNIFVKNAIKKPVEVPLIWKIPILLVKIYCETFTPLIYYIAEKALSVILLVNLPFVFARMSTRWQASVWIWCSKLFLRSARLLIIVMPKRLCCFQVCPLVKKIPDEHRSVYFIAGKGNPFTAGYKIQFTLGYASLTKKILWFQIPTFDL